MLGNRSTAVAVIACSRKKTLKSKRESKLHLLESIHYLEEAQLLFSMTSLFDCPHPLPVCQ